MSGIPFDSFIDPAWEKEPSPLEDDWLVDIAKLQQSLVLSTHKLMQLHAL